MASREEVLRGERGGGYLSVGWSVAEWRAEQESDPAAVESASRASTKVHVAAMVDFWNADVPTLDYGNNIRPVAKEEGLENAFAFPGFVPAYIRPLFCRGVGPFRWCALSGDPEDIYATDAKMKELFPDDEHLHHWLDMARMRIDFQGLPARICWIGLGERHRAGLAFNEMVRTGELKAPVVIGRDHLDSGSVASPNREIEAMRDGSDAVSDWPLPNALLNTASGATRVSLHHGGSVGMGLSQHSGLMICADDSEDADRRIANVRRRARRAAHRVRRRDARRRRGRGSRRAAAGDVDVPGRGRRGGRGHRAVPVARAVTHRSGPFPRTQPRRSGVPARRRWHRTAAVTGASAGVLRLTSGPRSVHVRPDHRPGLAGQAGRAGAPATGRPRGSARALS